MSYLNGCAYCVEHHADCEILEINQVTYFAYANCAALGSGITTDGDDLDTAPPGSDDITDWRHG